MGMSFHFVIFPEGYDNGINANVLNSIIELIINEQVISRDISATIYFPESDEYGKIPIGEFHHKIPIPVIEIINMVKKYQKGLISDFGMSFGSCDLLDNFLNEISPDPQELYEFPQVPESWGIYCGKYTHYGSDGNKDIQFTTHVYIEFEFTLRGTDPKEYAREVVKKPRVKSFIEGLSKILNAKINIRTYIT